MKGEERRKAVLDDAAALFADQGYHRTTVSHIVDRGGIARGTFYLYFNDKRSVFDELLDGFMTHLRSVISRIDPAQGMPESLREMRQNIKGVLEVCLEHRALTKILLSEAVGLDADFDSKLLAFWAEVTTLLEASLTLGQELGLLRPLNTRAVASCLLGSLKELLYQVIMRGLEVETDALVDELLWLYTRGVFVQE